MTDKEVADVLDQDKCVFLGREHGTFKVHRLFYSLLDRNWFVAVQDEKNQFVITVLNIAYHNRLSVSPDALRKARELVESELPSNIGQAVEVKEKVGKSKPKFQFIAHFVDRMNRPQRHGLFSVPMEDGVTEETVLDDPKVITLIKEKLRERIRVGERLVYVLVKLGKRGSEVAIDPRKLFK